MTDKEDEMDIKKILSNEERKNIDNSIKYEEFLPREKLQRYNLEPMTDQELMAILLRTGTKDQGVMELADTVLKFLASEPNLSDLQLEELMTIKGVGLSKATIILSGLELGKRLHKIRKRDDIRITDPKTVADYYFPTLGQIRTERFMVLHLDTKNRVIYEETVSEGSLNASIVHPREVFKSAIRKCANRIFLVHNHPSGDTNPSREDLEVTKRLVVSGQLLGIEVLDHVIIGDNEYLSMKEEGYI